MIVVWHMIDKCLITMAKLYMALSEIDDGGLVESCDLTRREHAIFTSCEAAEEFVDEYDYLDIVIYEHDSVAVPENGIVYTVCAEVREGTGICSCSSCKSTNLIYPVIFQSRTEAESYQAEQQQKCTCFPFVIVESCIR